jgi:hypothetical protein
MCDVFKIMAKVPLLTVDVLQVAPFSRNSTMQLKLLRGAKYQIY